MSKVFTSLVPSTYFVAYLLEAIKYRINRLGKHRDYVHYEQNKVDQHRFVIFMKVLCLSKDIQNRRRASPRKKTVIISAIFIQS